VAVIALVRLVRSECGLGRLRRVISGSLSLAFVTIPDALIGTPFPQRSPPWLIHRRSFRWLEASPCKATPEGLSPQRLDYRPKLRVLSGKLLIGRTRIDRHHTIITNSLPRSTNHADDLTSYRLWMLTRPRLPPTTTAAISRIIDRKR
jgi:hypothetical protein